MRDRIVLTKWPGSNCPPNNDSTSEYSPCQINNGLCLSTGDYILLFPANKQADLYIARIESILKDSIGKHMLHVRWFYRDKDLRHQPPSCPKSDEVYLTNYFDYQSGDSVVAKCKIVTKTQFRTIKMARWNEMVDARENLYVCEYTYSAETGAFTPIQDDLSEATFGEVNNKEQRAPFIADTLAKEFVEILINIEMSISEALKPYFWKSSRPAWMIKTKEARCLKDIVQAFLALEEGLQVFEKNKSSPCSDYITWKKTISEINSYELLAKYVKHFKLILSRNSTKLLDHASNYSSSMHTIDSAMQKKRKRCSTAELTMAKRPMKLPEGESIIPLPQSEALMMLPATALDSRIAEDTGIIRSGVVYEMDHRSLPPKVPIHMKSLRVVMVSEIASLHITVKFPSSLSLKMYFQTRRESTLNEVTSSSCSLELQQGTNMGTKPDMDEHFVMSTKTAEKVLVRPVSCTEYLHQGHLQTFWFTEDHMLNLKNLGEKNDLHEITQTMSNQVSEAPCHQAVAQTTEVGIPQQCEQLSKEEESTKSLTTTLDTMNVDDNTRYLLDCVGRVNVSNSQNENIGSPYRQINQSQKDKQPLKLTNFFSDDKDENNNNLQPHIQAVTRKNSVWAQDVSLLQNLECADNGDVDYDELAAGIKAAAETLAHLIPETMNNRDERSIGATVKAVQDNEGPIHWGIRRKVSSFGRCRGQSAGSYDTVPVSKDFDRNIIGKENFQGRSRSKLVNLAKIPGIQKNFVQNPATNSSSNFHNAQEKLNFSSQPNILKLPKDMQGRWSSERYKSAQLKLLDIMHQRGAAPGNPILRPALREEARKHIGDTGLLDHLLKHMTDTVVCNGERFRRRHNAEGAMEYWLEDASLMDIRRMAGIEDPSWIPPPGWKPGDKLPERGGCIYSKGMSPSEAAEMKQLKEDVESLKSEMLSIASQLKGAQTDVHMSSSVVPDQKNLPHQNCSEKSSENDMKSQLQVIKLKILEMQSALRHVQEQQQNQDKILLSLQIRKPETSLERNNLQRKEGDETALVERKETNRLDYTIKRLENLELEVQKLSQDNITYEIYISEKKALESQLSATWKTIAKIKEEYQTTHETIGVRKPQTQQPVACPLKISSLPILYSQAKGDLYSGMTHAFDQKSSLGTAAIYDLHPQIENLKSASHNLHTKEVTLVKNQLHNIQNSSLYYSAQVSASHTICGTAPHESPKISMRMPKNIRERCNRKPPTIHQLPSAFPWPAGSTSSLHVADDGLSPFSTTSASASSSPTFYNLKAAQRTTSTNMTMPPQMLPSYDHEKLGSLPERTKCGHAKLTYYEQTFMRNPLSVTGASSSASFLPENAKHSNFLFSAATASIDDSNRCSLSVLKKAEDSSAGQITPRVGSQGHTLTTIASSVLNNNCGPPESEDIQYKLQSTKASPEEEYDNRMKDPVTHLSLAFETSCSSCVVVTATSTMQTDSRGTDELNASLKNQCFDVAPPSSLMLTQALSATSMSKVAQTTHAGLALENFQQAVVSSVDHMRNDTSAPTHKLSESSIPTDGLSCFLVRKSGEIVNTLSMTSR